MQAHQYSLPGLLGTPPPVQDSKHIVQGTMTPRRYGDPMVDPRCAPLSSRSISHSPLSGRSISHSPEHPLLSTRSISRSPDQSLDWMRPWLEAASEFELNTDFDVDEELTSEPMPLHAIMAVMKSESRDKRTIQALADKILLHGMIDNLGVQQMPFLFSSYGTVNAGQVEKLVDTLERSGDDQAFDLVSPESQSAFRSALGRTTRTQ